MSGCMETLFAACMFVRACVGSPSAGFALRNAPFCGLRPLAGFPPVRVSPLACEFHPFVGLAPLRVSPLCGFRLSTGVANLRVSPLCGFCPSFALIRVKLNSRACFTPLRFVPLCRFRLFAGVALFLCGLFRGDSIAGLAPFQVSLYIARMSGGSPWCHQMARLRGGHVRLSDGNVKDEEMVGRGACLGPDARGGGGGVCGALP